MKTTILKQGLMLAILVPSLMLISCGKDKKKGSTKPTGAPQQEVTTSNLPANFAYSFRINEKCIGYCNDFSYSEQCEARQTLNNLEEYCSALQDAALNNNCARRERKAAFIHYCSGKFNETNVAAVSGVDEDGRFGSCTYSIPESTGSEYCRKLKDENEHQFCGWEERRTLFKKYECDGVFSTLADLDPEVVIFDDGIETMEGNFHEYNVTLDKTYVLFRNTLRIPRVDVQKRMNFTALTMKEDNCEVQGQARLVGRLLKTTDTGATTSTDIDFTVRPPAIDTNNDYEFVFEVTNPGLCKDFEIGYRLEL